MTTQFRRWLRGFGMGCMVVALAAVLSIVVSSRALAQPYAAVLMDARSGQVLFQTDNANARLHPASLTKMMTLYIAFEALQNGEITLDTPVRISRHAAAQPPSRLGLRAGQTIAFRHLIRAAALRSANDAATAIGEALEGSVPAFAQRMNRTARAMGMSRTNFANPHGLTQEGHLSSAMDMTILGRQLYFDYPDYYNIFSRLSEDAGIAQVANTNRLFLGSYRGADGIKTGFTNAAGYNLTAMAERDGVRLIVTVFGARSSQDRVRRVAQLMDRGFGEAPRRVAVQRPARPSYVRGSDDRGSGPAAGRVIRLQTAPTTSRIPRPRPMPGQAPSEDLIAALRSTIDEVIEDIREPDASADTDETGVAPGVTSEEPDEAPEGTGAAVAIALAPPATSPLPPRRPGSGDPAEGPGVEVARAAGFTVIDPAQYAALTEGGATPDDGATPGETGAEAPAAVAAAVPESAVEAALQTALAMALPDTAPAPAPRPAAIEAAAPAATAPIETTPVETAAAEPAPTEPAPVLQLAGIDPVVTPELSVDDDGRILWRDEELLQALTHEDPEDPVLLPTIVLTSAADAPPPPAVSAPVPEIITRVSTSGGRLWQVELGRFNSSFAAERALLGVALSEAATLGNGVRRVVSRGGRHVAEVASLTQEEAQLACARLAARSATCEVIEP